MVTLYLNILLFCSKFSEYQKKLIHHWVEITKERKQLNILLRLGPKSQSFAFSLKIFQY